MHSILISAFLYIIIFVTGFAGLIYQVAWQKYLSRMLGSDSIATAIILATFLGGLSAGYYICGKLTTRVKNHFKAYAVLEGIIGAWCINFPMLFDMLASATQHWRFSPPLLIILQGVFCSALLMGIPTICMGGTIPFLTRGISGNIREATHVHANVYAVNTAGAFAGALAAGFYLIPEYGLPLSVMGTASLNFAAFAFFYAISLRFRSQDAPAEAEAKTENSETGSGQISEPETSRRFSPRILYAVAFLSGFYVMTLENVLIRIINLSMGSSSYSFSLIVSVFILSIAVGSYVVGRFRDMSPRMLFTNQLLITLLLLLTYLTLDTWPYWAHLVRIAFQSHEVGRVGYYICAFMALFAALILPVGCMGATVPIAFHEIKRDLGNVGKHSGILFSLNTVGSLSGSLIGGIILYYFMDNPGVFLTAMLLAALSTCLAARQSIGAAGGRYFAYASLLAVLLLVFSVFSDVLGTPFYNQDNFKIGTFRTRSPLSYSFDGPKDFFPKFNKGYDLKFYKDGPSATVAVTESSHEKPVPGKSMAILVNGKSDSSTRGDSYTLKLLAHIPALLAKQRKDIMLIGLGTGVTLGELSLYPDAEHIDVAEISPTVAEALPLFREYTYDVHKDPRVSIRLGDAFRILGRSRKKWDIIISEPSNPWVTGIDLLFTQEFYKLAKAHLKEGGILIQWMQLYATSPDMVGMMVNTIRQEFEHACAFIANGPDMLLVAPSRPFSTEDFERADAILKNNGRVRASLEDLSMASVDAILMRQVWPASYILDKFSGYGLQTMDNPRLHYMAGKNFFMGKGLPNNFLFSPATVPYAGDFLIAAKYENWSAFPSEKEQYDALKLSLKNKYDGTYLPRVKTLKVKYCLNNPDSDELSEKEKTAADIITFSMNLPQDETAWEDIGLEENSYREKARLLLTHKNHFRNWIFPYPLDGLEALLEKGMSEGEDVYEKNWCALQMAMLLGEARHADKNRIRGILNRAARGTDGKIIVGNGDENLLKAVNKFISGL